MEYALNRNMSSTMISEYRAKLISKEILQKNWKNYMTQQDSSAGSEISIPIYDISAEEFLEFAENEMLSGTEEVYLLTIQYFDYGNINLYKKK